MYLLRLLALDSKLKNSRKRRKYNTYAELEDNYYLCSENSRWSTERKITKTKGGQFSFMVPAEHGGRGIFLMSVKMAPAGAM